MKRTAIVLFSIVCGGMLCACIPTEKYYRGDAATPTPIASPANTMTPYSYGPGASETPYTTGMPDASASPDASGSPSASPDGSPSPGDD